MGDRGPGAPRDENGGRSDPARREGLIENQEKASRIAQENRLSDHHKAKAAAAAAGSRGRVPPAGELPPHSRLHNVKPSGLQRR